MEKKVLIAGATGVTGGHTIANLLNLNIPVRALVHRLDERSEALEKKGVEVVEGNLSDFTLLGKALQDVRAAYYLFPSQQTGIIESTAYFAQAALDNGVEAIVNISQLSASPKAKSYASQNHWIAERIFDRSGVPVTHIRPTFFAEWLLYAAPSLQEQNVLIYPFGDVACAPIAGEDQGRVIAAILANPVPHAGKIYPLYGREELTHYQIAEMLSEVIGRKIVYEPVEIAEFGPVLTHAMQANDYFVQHILSAFEECQEGIFSGTNTNVEDITGKKPISMREFIEKNKSVFL